MLAVLVQTDAAAQLTETATYCKTGDAKRPAVVGLPDFTTAEVCPADLSMGATEVDNAFPDGWYIRIMFDELLDPEIETLTEIKDSDGEGTGTFSGSIAASHPVELKCESVTGGMVNVDYDGYYQPAGNRVTWPLGPSLVIIPNDAKTIATNTPCEMTINTSVVLDKQGETVPSGDAGPYKFRVAPIKAIAIDPPDDPEYATAIPAQQIFYDNGYVQFNTFVDPSSLCPENGNDTFGMCDEELVKFKAADGTALPGKCDTTLKGCVTMADCDAAGGDTYCGRGYCDYNGTPCRDFADCNAAGGDTNCGVNQVYSYLPFGLTDREFGFGPMMPLATETKYTWEIPMGTKLKDRCGRETTFGAPSADDNTLIHFVTKKFDFVKANIATGETAQGVKKPLLSWNNVVEGGDFPYYTLIGLGTLPPTAVPTLADTEWSLDPLPYLNATTQLTQSQVAIADLALSGQIEFRGHFKLATDYTFTLKAGATVNDAYGKTWTNPEDLVIKWKTEPALRVTSLGLRDTAQLISAVDKGTVTKSSPSSDLDIRVGFNQAMDPTTIGADDFDVSPAPVGLAPPTPVQSGCGTTSTSCTLRLRAKYPPGDYKITLKKDAKFKDIFGNEYTQAADQVIHVTVKEAPASAPCL